MTLATVTSDYALADCLLTRECIGKKTNNSDVNGDVSLT